MDEPHAELVARATRGDPTAIENLLCRNLAALRAFVRAKAGPRLLARESASDVVQSVCRELLEDLPVLHFDSEPAFRAWLFRAAWHKLVDRARRLETDKRDVARERVLASDAGDDHALATFLTPSRDACAREDLARLEQAFDELPDEYREAIVLHKVAGLSYGEISAELGRSEGACRNLVYRGLARLAELLGPD